MKEIQIKKKVFKLSIFAVDKIIYLSDPENSTIEHLKLINNFCELYGYQIKSNKSLAFLYTEDEQVEKEIRGTTPFTIVTNIKYFGVTLTK